MTRVLALLAFLLTVTITTSSPFIRHAQDGLGCDPWPACYREVPPAAARAVLAPGLQGSPSVGTARRVHGGSATVVGVLAIALAVFGWTAFDPVQRAASVLALAITAGLAWLGRYTPHALPLVTVGNVLGGLALAAAFALIATSRGRSATTREQIENRFTAQPGKRSAGQPAAEHPATDQAAAPGRDQTGALLAGAALVLVCLLGWLGVMIGAHHGADACAAASCIGDARLDFLAFDPLRTGLTVDLPARQALHLADRLTAVALAVVVIGLAWRTAQSTRRAFRSASDGTARSVRAPAGVILALLVLTAYQQQ